MVDVVFRSTSVGIADYHCRERDPGLGPEELADSYQVVLPRAGMFVRHVSGENIVGDANHALFFNLGERYRVSHPAGCGDHCTTITFTSARVRECIAHFDPDSAAVGPVAFPRSHTTTSPTIDLLHRRLLRAVASGLRRSPGIMRTPV